MLSFLIIVLVVLLLTVVPVMVAARIVGARNTGFWRCLLALFVSSLVVGVALRVFHGGGLLAFFVAPLGFMWMLDTTYLRALAMVVLQYLVTGLVIVLLMFTALGSLLHTKELMRSLPIDNPPAQPV